MKITGKAFVDSHFVWARISVENGVITGIDELSGRHGGDFILPGLVDVHTHGAFGADFTQSGREELKTALKEYAGRGTTALLATTASQEPKVLLKAAKTISGLSKAEGARILGINMEGPFFGAEKRGAHPERYLMKPDFNLLDDFLEAAGGLVKIICFDPLLEDSAELCKRYSDKYVLSVAHTACTRAEAHEAFNLGAAWLTHALNGMEQVNSREPGPLSAALDGRCGIEVIGDCRHVHPFWLRTLFALAPGRMVLISDSTEACGMPEGRYMLCGDAVIKRDGGVYTPEGRLAGSASTLFDNLRATAEAGVPLALAVAAASENPARLLGLDAGRIRVGARADMLICGHDLTLKQALLCGQEV